MSSTDRIHEITDVQASLARLAAAADLSALMRSAPVELCECGFARAALSTLDGSLVIPEAIHSDDPGCAARLLQLWRAEPPSLARLPIEAEMVRTRAPALVFDAAADDRLDRELLEACATRSYVAAPIVVEGTVVGFLHADRGPHALGVDEVDRSLLTIFAGGLGSAYERSRLVMRLRSLRREIHRANHTIAAITDELCDADVELVRGDHYDDVVARSAATLLVPSPASLDALLTRREMDVMRMLVTGATNAAIASRLVVSQETVKSHVKHILRKLRASNRAEAVSRFITLAAHTPTLIAPRRNGPSSAFDILVSRSGEPEQRGR